MAGAWNPNRWSSSWNAPWGRRLKLAAGALVTPRLRLVRPIADVPSGNVWVADHLSLDVQVAVKFQADAGSDGEETGNETEAPPPSADRFARQAFVAGRLSEAHLVKILEHGIAKGAVPFIASELLEGKSLRQRLLQVGSIGLLEAQDVLQQVASVLSKAHALGLAHGSLCPDHLFWLEVANRPFVKILNFGDAPAQSSGETLNPRRHPYLSPEQLQAGRGNTAESDLWALSVTLYELLTTTLPFEAETPEGITAAICGADFAPPTQYRGDLPVAVDAWFKRALAKDPLKRFQSASELALGFARALVDEAEPAHPSSPTHAPVFNQEQPAVAPDTLTASPPQAEVRMVEAVSSEPPLPLSERAQSIHALIDHALFEHGSTDVGSPAIREAQPALAEIDEHAPDADVDRALQRLDAPSLPRFGEPTMDGVEGAAKMDGAKSEAVTATVTALASMPVDARVASSLEDEDDEADEETSLNADSLLEDDDETVLNAEGLIEDDDGEDDEEELTRKWDMPSGWAPQDGIGGPDRISSLPPPLPPRRSSRPPPPPGAVRSGTSWSVDARPRPSLALTALTGEASPIGSSPGRTVTAVAAAAEPRTVVARAVGAPGWPSAKTKVLLSALLAGLGLLTTWRFMKASSARARATAEMQSIPTATSALSPAAEALSTKTLAERRAERRREASLQVIRTDDLPPAPEETEDGAELAEPGAAADAPIGQVAAAAPVAASQPAPKAPAPAVNQTARALVRSVAPKAPPPAKSKPAVVTTKFRALPLPTRASKRSSTKPASAASDCTPPYYFDKNNIKRLKLDCL
jgi:serine/threonine protein kinase